MFTVAVIVVTINSNNLLFQYTHTHSQMYFNAMTLEHWLKFQTYAYADYTQWKHRENNGNERQKRTNERVKNGIKSKGIRKSESEMSTRFNVNTTRKESNCCCRSALTLFLSVRLHLFLASLLAYICIYVFNSSSKFCVIIFNFRRIKCKSQKQLKAMSMHRLPSLIDNDMLNECERVSVRACKHVCVCLDCVYAVCACARQSVVCQWMRQRVGAHAQLP